MKTKLLLIIILGISIAACSDESTAYEASAAPTYEALSPETYSQEKDNYCADAEDKNSCSCQFDVMDPILTASIGSNWSTKSMEEKDFPTYVKAVETAVKQCP
ncbi:MULTISPECIES: hypothetical protein [Psychrobacter]|jgi:hypothetical protein|uniref:hypothetical protein n=1 Tax=Psychrobacter TaxID=497 RepID=UPI00078CD7E4|nr:hypothetical protein [Psychrobacter sp. P11G5]AMN69041.1 hypothetical protein AK825_14385 [Psychrobacter sp. P11G5]|tara:strand:+ start:3794 stop:4102 length:309 start_codon:yes stop_codon:yes gene_type:complete